MCEVKDINTFDKLKNKAKVKYLNFPVISLLSALDSPLKQKYQSTFYCSSFVKLHEGQTSSRYCKRPWCNMCNRIRVAIRLNNYSDQLTKIMEECGLHMTTLTLPNCSSDFIKPSFERYRQIFRQFRNTLKKKEGIVLRGCYNLECSINITTKLFHPHIHIIHESLPVVVIAGKEWKAQISGGHSTGCNIKYGNTIISYWLKKNPQCDAGAQDCRICFNLIEGFKYSNKSIFKIKLHDKNLLIVPVLELDIIYQSIAGMRLFQTFGIKKTVVDEDKEFEKLDAYTVEGKQDGIYKWLKHDWFHKIDSTPLSDYKPTEKQKETYERIAKNKHYQSTVKTEIPNKKRVWAIPEPEGSAEHYSALQRILDKRREKPKVS